MAADPEGRYLLAYDLGAHALKRIVPGQSPVVVTTLYTASGTPGLDQVSRIEVRDHPTWGHRRFLLRRMFGDNYPMSQERYGILADDDNDGAFESLVFLTNAQMTASPYGAWEDWRLFWQVE